MNNVPEIIVAIGNLLLQIGTLAGVLSGIYIAIRRGEKATAQRTKLSAKVEEIHIATNSMKDEAVAAAEKMGAAQGELKGTLDTIATQTVKDKAGKK